MKLPQRAFFLFYFSSTPLLLLQGEWLIFCSQRSDTGNLGAGPADRHSRRRRRSLAAIPHRPCVFLPLRKQFDF